MGRITGLFITLLLLLTRTSVCSTFLPLDLDRILGHMEHRVDNDSVVISFDLRILDNADSVVLQPSYDCIDKEWGRTLQSAKPITIYYRDGGLATSASNVTAVVTPEALLLKGTISVPSIDGCRPEGCDVDAFGTVDTLRWHQTRWADFDPSGSAAFTLMPYVGAAYYRSTPGPGTEKNGFAAGLDWHVSVYIRRFEFDVSYRLSIGRAFRVREGIPISLRYYLGSDNGFRPSIWINPKYSVLYSRKDDVEFVLGRWGAEAGVAIEGPFERLSYSYTTSIGGFHKVGLFVAGQKTGTLRIGTQYEFYKFDNATMFRALMVFEGFPVDQDMGLRHWPTTLRWPSNRPWWHKGLAYFSVAPFLGIIEVLKLFGVH